MTARRHRRAGTMCETAPVGEGRGVTQTLLQGVLLRHTRQFARPTAMWQTFGVDVLFGVIVAFAVLAARRWPTLPSTILAVLTYGVFADPFAPPLSWSLPDLGPWLPRLTGFVGDNGRWDTTEVLLVLGIMLVATSWAWTRPVLARRGSASGAEPDRTPTALP